MKVSFLFSVVCMTATPTLAYVTSSSKIGVFGIKANPVSSSSSVLHMVEIRPPTEKADTLRFGWDGTTPLGGAVEIAKPARMLAEIRASGETIPSECEMFNNNIDMDSSNLMLEDVLETINSHYETQLLEYRVGNIVNKQGENEATGLILSYAALSNMNQETTLKLWGQYYRDVLKNPTGTDHANIREFMKTGWKGVPFENGIALTKKNIGGNDWDAYSESWIP